jgi:4-hydroxy-3-methylbut-2-en-1-yl diphosphate reductase
MTQITTKITLAKHYGMCFGVRDAISAAETAARNAPVTLLGELVHNPAVMANFTQLGAKQARLDQPGTAATPSVIITAHGAADRDHAAWKARGYQVTDTTCPLVRKAHHALQELTEAGYHPVVIGQASHAEVLGLVGDFPQASVVLTVAQIAELPEKPHYGVISQTTQPVERVLELVAALRQQFPASGIHYRDTVCRPTKQRQTAMEQLCMENQVIIIVGGANSNNSRQLLEKALAAGRTAYLVQSAADLCGAWFTGVQSIGVTAGTSTLEETVQAVLHRLRELTTMPATLQ